MNRYYLKIVFLALLFLSVRNCFSQELPPLEPISKHYKMFAQLSAMSNPARTALDTIIFPWTDYSTKSVMTTMHLIYLNPEDSAQLPGLIHYPANSSDQTRAELDYLLTLQSKRTKDEIARTQVIANIGPWPNITNPTDSNYSENRRQLFFVATSVGAWFNPQNFPATTYLLMNCLQDIRLTEFYLKRDFKRSRPYHLEPKLNPLTQILTPAFPSGHTLWAFTDAYVFGEIIPEKREAFLNAAEEVRWSREVMGIHFPSDNEASRIIGWYLLKFWHHNPRFVSDLEKAKAEWQSKKNRFK